MKRLLLVCLATAALAVLLFLCVPVARRSAVAQRESAGPARGERAGAELAAEEEPDEGRARGVPAMEATAGADRAASAEAQPTALRVVSTLGLDLERAFVTGADGLEREVALGPDGAPAVPLELPCDVRAAGHRSVRVAGPGIVELKPVFGLVLRAPGLSERLVEVQLPWGHVDGYLEMEDALACGTAGGDALALAIDWERVATRIAGEPRLSFSTVDNRYYEAVPAAGTEGTFEERLELKQLDLATVALDAVCPQRCTAPPRIDLSAELPPRFNDERIVRRQPTAWGKLQIYEAWALARTVAGGLPERVVSGQEYGASALCPECGAYGRCSFVAVTGASRIEIPLDRSPVLLRASVAPGQWDMLRLEWTFERERVQNPERREELRGWRGDAALPVAPDGTLELRLPATVPPLRAAAWPMPPLLRLRVKAGGGEELLLYVDLPPDGAVDLGRLPLYLSGTQVVLGPGHGIADAQALTALGGGKVQWFGIDHPKDCFLRADGGLEIRLTPQEPYGDPFLFAGASRPAELLVADGFSRARAFAWDGAAYAPLPEESRTLRIECSPLPGVEQQARFGISWHGLDLELGAMYSGTSKDWLLTWPAGAELWWSFDRPSSFEPGRGGTVALTPELAVLRVP